MFGCETVSDWIVGSPLLWQSAWEGQTMVFVKGTIVTIESPTHVAYTTFDPNSTLDDVPKNYVTVTYDLSEENAQTRLVVTQSDSATVLPMKNDVISKPTMAVKAGTRSWLRSRN